MSGSVSQGQLTTYSVPVIAGRAIVIRTVAPNDVDLYLQLNTAPTTSSYLARGYTTSGNETLRLVPTASGTLFIGVHGYVASTYTLQTSDN